MPDEPHAQAQRRQIEPAAAARPAGRRAELAAGLAQRARRPRRAARSGTGRSPTRVAYALVMPTTRSICVGPMPALWQAPAAIVDDDVTYG